MAINRTRDIRPCREFIRAGVQLDAGKLRDEEVDLKSLVPSP